MSVSIPDVDADSPDLSEADQLIRRFIKGKREDTDTPYRDADILMHLYWDCERSQAEVGDELGCSAKTVCRWLDKTDIGARSRSEAQRVERAHFDPATKDGQEEWRVRDPDGGTAVKVHQLLAVADGADPGEVWDDDTHVHHKTCIPWLNLPGFVEVLSGDDHRATHTADKWTEDGGIPVLETQD